MPESTRPPAGMRDFLPASIRRREAVLRVIREVYESHGFEPLETPAMERLDVLLGKYGDEGDQLLFRVMKRGDKLEEVVRTASAGVADLRRTTDQLADAGLRYDLTVPLARVVAEHQSELPRVFKRYQVQPVWRADRPQKGRYREFLQCDVDVCGSASRAVEVEVISAVSEVLDRLGFTDARIRIHHRAILAGYGEAMGVGDDGARAVITALDKLDKIGVDGVVAEIGRAGLGSLEPHVRELCAKSAAGGTNDERLAAIEAFVAGFGREAPSAAAGLADLRTVLGLLAATPAAARIDVDPTLARGLSYYTGSIFEIVSPAFSGSLGGGGRYDGLIGMFLGRPVPACGFSIGLERILLLLEERGQAAGTGSCADVMVGQFDASLAGESIRLAAELRAAGLRTDLHCDAAKVGKQFQDADARGIACVALVGPDELARGTVALKMMKSGERADVPRAEAAAWIRTRLQAPADGAR